MKRTVFGWGPTAVWAGVLFLLSAWEEPSGLSILELPDEILHLGIYGVFGATLWWARRRRHPGVSPLAFWVIGWIYAISDEWHQSFVAGRDASVGDLISDFAGVVIGFGVMSVAARIREHGRARPANEE